MDSFVVAFIRMFSVASVVLLFAVPGIAANPKGPLRTRQFHPGSVQRPEDLPASRLRTQLERLPAEKRGRALGVLRDFHFTEIDLDMLEADAEGGIYYADNFHLEADAAAGETESDPVTAQASIPVDPLAAHLLFHSRPGAPNVLYLDFTGEQVSGTQWNTSARTVISAVAYSIDTDYSTFSDAEQTAIKRIWRRVAEDFSPFNIDVTTERPAVLGSRVAHAVITRNTDASGSDNPAGNSGGVAYVNVFGGGSYASYRPAWVYVNNLGNSESVIAEATSHEIGHNMGLSHDGLTDGTAYYSGHGSGQTSWGTIMGASSSRNVTQWSNGGYYMANNTQDDLAVIAGKISYRADDHGGSISSATPLIMDGTSIVSTTPEEDPANSYPANKGVLERNTDVDMFSFVTGNGPVNITVNPNIMSTGSRGGNFDILLELRDQVGNVLLTNNVSTVTTAEIRTNLAAGTYFLAVKNTGVGDPLSSSPTGYSNYGSIGQYFINGTVTAAVALLTTNHPTPVSWLISFGYTNNFETAVNLIGANGLPLWQSYIAGLNPTVSDSRLRLNVRRSTDGNSAVVSWNPVAGRVYSLFSSTNAAAAFTAIPDATRLPATVRSYTNAISPTKRTTFYRLAVEAL